MGRSVYLVATQYHFLLASAIAAYLDKSAEKHLLISSHFNDTDRLIRALNGWKKNPFATIKVVNKRWRRGGVIDKITTIWSGFHNIRKFLERLPDGGFDAYIFNIEQPEGQFVAYANHVRKGKNIYGEDGIGAYTQRRFGDSFPVKLIKKRLYGDWYRRVDTQISYPYFDEIMVLRPELIERKPAKTALKRIPADVFARLDRDGLIGRMLAEYGIKKLECEAIVLVPNSKQAEAMGYGRTVGAYSQLLDALVRKRVKTIVKYHPREEKGDFLGAAHRKLEMIDPLVSSEMLFLRWKGRKRIAIGDATTALCSCKLIVPDSTALSIMEAIGYKGDEGLKKVFRKWGVLCPKTIEEAVGLIRGRG
ncbi:MAG: hypothetical protein PHV13_00235 [Candidatus ainarchaeum sp.]|nr:hypothetical protein [Candidatus ainarchaeum sp.]